MVLGGGAIGSLARYLLSGVAHRYYIGIFPLGTLLVNIIGSFIIGLIWGFWEQATFSVNMRTFIFIGILGGFTTFSSYSLETMNLFRDNEIRLGVFNILANNVLGIAFVFLGFIASKQILNLIR